MHLTYVTHTYTHAHMGNMCHAERGRGIHKSKKQNAKRSTQKKKKKWPEKIVSFMKQSNENLKIDVITWIAFQWTSQSCHLKMLSDAQWVSKFFVYMSPTQCDCMNAQSSVCGGGSILNALVCFNPNFNSLSKSIQSFILRASREGCSHCPRWNVHTSLKLLKHMNSFYLSPWGTKWNVNMAET